MRSELPFDTRGSGRKWLTQHNFDRVERWETERLRIIDRIKDREILATILPMMDCGYRFEEVASVDGRGAGRRCTRSASTATTTRSSPAASSTTTPNAGWHPLAMRLLADIDEDTVDMMPNYDGTTEEPVVLPARFPNLLVNGSQGIAVGMATNIPPHNLGEVIDATIHLIDHPDATPDDLMQFVKGPDFPTGGQHPRPGRHHRRLPHRSRQREDAGTAMIEESKSGPTEIVVTELPYQTSCSAIAGRDPGARRRRRPRRHRRRQRRAPRAARPTSSSRSSATPTPTS